MKETTEASARRLARILTASSAIQSMYHAIKRHSSLCTVAFQLSISLASHEVIHAYITHTHSQSTFPLFGAGCGVLTVNDLLKDLLPGEENDTHTDLGMSGRGDKVTFNDAGRSS